MFLISCPFCKSQRFRFLCKINLNTLFISGVVECEGCRLVFVNPMLTTQELDQIYSPRYFVSGNPRFGFENYFANYRSQVVQGRVLGRRLQKTKPRGRVLDVGCALGFLLDGLRQSCDWEVYGVELSSWAAQFAREKLGLQVHAGTLEEAPFPDGFFDAILLNDLLEHLPDPVAFLDIAHRKLAPGGLIFVHSPNGRCDVQPFIDAHREGTIRIQSQAHLFYFYPDVLKTILESTGFEVVEMYTQGLKAGLRDLGYLRRKRENVAAAVEGNGPTSTGPVNLELDLRLPGLHTLAWRARNWLKIPARFPVGHELRVVAKKAFAPAIAVRQG